MSGVMLSLLGVLRIGTLVRHIPHAVTVGFTAGIAVTIAASQIKDFAGIRLSAHEPSLLLPKLAALLPALPTLNGFALALGVITTAMIFLVKRLRPAWPGMLIGVALSSALALVLHWPVETIASRPLLVIGSGGSVTACHLIAKLQSEHPRQPVRVLTPYEFLLQPADGLSSVLLLSAGGSNRDILRAASKAMACPERAAGPATGC